MSTVQLTDQSEDVKRLVEQAESGAVSFLKDGREVAKIISVPVELQKFTEEESEAAWKRLSALMEKGLDLGGVWNGRDELYDRD